jgi:hypothetical protein
MDQKRIALKIFQQIHCFFFYVLILTAVAIGPGRALAIEQPNGTPIPTVMTCPGNELSGLEAIFACICNEEGICNIGNTCPLGTAPCDDGLNGTCETTLWHSENDNTCIPSNISGLDPQDDASLTPETIIPGCTLRFTMVSRGIALFQDAFGWYNVTDSIPAAEDLHVILDSSAATGTVVEVDIREDPDWTGGEIGFFLVTPESHSSQGSCDSGNCNATVERYASGAGYAFFSQREYNPDYIGASSYIHMLIYESRITEGKYYFAWEDLYSGFNNDFTDIVTSVESVDCGSGKSGKGGCGMHAGDGTAAALFFGFMIVRGFFRRRNNA